MRPNLSPRPLAKAETRPGYEATRISHAIFHVVHDIIDFFQQRAARTVLGRAHSKFRTLISNISYAFILTSRV